MRVGEGHFPGAHHPSHAKPGQERAGQVLSKHYMIYFSVLELSAGSRSAKRGDFFILI